MSIHFSKIIKAGDRNREFNFTRTNPSSHQYSVNVPDERGNRIFFTISQDGGGWKIDPNIIPEWILEVETALSNAIDEVMAMPVDKDKDKYK